MAHQLKLDEVLNASPVYEGMSFDQTQELPSLLEHLDVKLAPTLLAFQKGLKTWLCHLARDSVM